LKLVNHLLPHHSTINAVTRLVNDILQCSIDESNVCALILRCTIDSSAAFDKVQGQSVLIDDDDNELTWRGIKS